MFSPAKRQNLVFATVLVILICAMLAYFVKPKAPLLELVSPAQVLPSYEARYPGDAVLQERILKSYALAIVLVHSPYMQKNVIALENIREWARRRFQSTPDFLHPSSLSVSSEYHDTVFGAIGYNLFAGIRYWAEEQVGEIMRLQIAQFHQSSAFQSFKTAYFEFFGKDADTATLLAKYESERARPAVDVVLTSLIWFAFVVAAVVNVATGKRGKRWNRLRRMVAAAWLLLSACYLMSAWMGGLVSTLASAMFSLAIGLYLAKPLALVSHQEAGKRILRIHMQPNWIAMVFWATMSVLAIQVLTWIRAGLAAAPDPISLLLAAGTGNFLHDHVYGKRLIMGLIAAGWLLLTVWTMRQQRHDGIEIDDNEDSWAGLKTEYSLER